MSSMDTAADQASDPTRYSDGGFYCLRHRASKSIRLPHPSSPTAQEFHRLNTALLGHLERLQARADDTPAPPRDEPAGAQEADPFLPHFRVKASKPPEFNGKNKRLATTFLAHLSLSFAADPASSRNPQQKIVFAASYLRDQAFAWYEPHLLNNSVVTRDWETFKTEFVRALGDPDLQRTLERELYALRQTGSAADYSTKFFKICSQLNWNDEPLRAQFRKNLKDDVKDALAYTDQTPSSVEDLSALAIRLGNRLFERRLESRRSAASSNSAPQAIQTTHTTTQTSTTTAPAHSRTGPVPMELDATRSRFQPLKDEERARRRRLGLCLYCAEPGHVAQQCPKKPASRSQRHRANAVTYTISAEPGNDHAQESGRNQP
ncbi:unnamed protein product [Tilletia laevis]|uniref:Uncharacterized protein n=1 Tax=Tilletia laevis TaxID=157183 RepID=A0A9N8MJR5_9BASI|nr:hypothetical protein CF336_g4809 [Tilletia laevis]KAE8195141.1 hypothetical protein CF335_g5162 [Tilletia laevis]CAD6939444.1 unnamed protein product [Tilletia laevis]CAD6951698.1 unnamed protein product [Tilletia caries]CAD6966654.1 unnamed protein product [Tilletia laevis]